MADFARALAKTAAHEAGYANHPSDKGGETWAGITRRDHPDWKGWAIIDRVKARLHVKNVTKSAALDAALKDDPDLSELTAERYREQYWNPLDLDTEPSQAIAEKAFDIAVNMGVGTARKMLAEARK